MFFDFKLLYLFTLFSITIIGLDKVITQESFLFYFILFFLVMLFTIFFSKFYAKKTTNIDRELLIKQNQDIEKKEIKILIAGITHEINTPLTYMKGSCELMMYDIEDLEESDDKVRMLDNLNVINEGIFKISHTIAMLKELSQVSSEFAVKINIYDSLIKSLYFTKNRSQQISHIYINDKLFSSDTNKNNLEFYVTMQKERMLQVWIILINNALDELLKLDHYEERRLDIYIKQFQDKLVIDFCENIGAIDDKLMDTIFEPFVHKKISSGIGIELSVVKKIIEENNGTISVKNNNQGTKFTIELQV